MLEGIYLSYICLYTQRLQLPLSPFPFPLSQFQSFFFPFHPLPVPKGLDGGWCAG